MTAKGPVFSSGHDLKELTSAQGREHHTKVFESCSQVSFCQRAAPNRELPVAHDCGLQIGNCHSFMSGDRMFPDDAKYSVQNDKYILQPMTHHHVCQLTSTSQRVDSYSSSDTQFCNRLDNTWEEAASEESSHIETL